MTAIRAVLRSPWTSAAAAVVTLLVGWQLITPDNPPRAATLAPPAVLPTQETTASEHPRPTQQPTAMPPPQPSNAPVRPVDRWAGPVSDRMLQQALDTATPGRLPRAQAAPEIRAAWRHLAQDLRSRRWTELRMQASTATAEQGGVRVIVLYAGRTSAGDITDRRRAVLRVRGGAVQLQPPAPDALLVPKEQSS